MVTKINKFRHLFINGALFGALLLTVLPACEVHGSKETSAAEFLPGSQLTSVWANDGGDKVTRDELRAAAGLPVINSVWDGSKVHQFGAKNEVVSINLVLEAARSDAKNIRVVFDKLTGPLNTTISSKVVEKQDVFKYKGRDIELFFIRYLQIKGLSRLGYDPTYDEQHIPKRFRVSQKGGDKGFSARTDANKFYPDIAVPMEAVGTFSISGQQNQSIWIDVYIPKTALPGKYRGTIRVLESEVKTVEIPVEIEVFDFMLPDKPSAKTMLYFSESLVNDRYFGNKWPDLSKEPKASVKYLENVWNSHHLVAHRHKISLIDDGFASIEKMQRWKSVLSGELFSAKNGYDGPGMDTSSGVYSIGTYGMWRNMWSPDSEAAMRKSSDKWATFFGDNFPQVEAFLYLLDEPQPAAYPKVEQWASWVKNNPGPGSRLQTFVTKDIVTLGKKMPSVSLGVDAWGDTQVWRPLIESYQKAGKKYWAYNGIRFSSGSFMTEDDGVSLRAVAWTQFKHKIDRWFFWESTAYLNTDRGGYETNVFEEAATFGGTKWNHPKYGETAPGYGNGDGVLFYPGTEKRYPKNNYGLTGPIASLRLKLWRRGIQDVDYLTMAAKIDPQAVDKIVQRIIPKVLWEVGVKDPKDPTYVYADISWSTDPDVWEKARRELANIILSASTKGNK